jgi:hypothetical protein
MSELELREDPETEAEAKEVGNQLMRWVAYSAIAAVAAVLVILCVLVFYLIGF